MMRLTLSNMTSANPNVSSFTRSRWSLATAASGLKRWAWMGLLMLCWVSCSRKFPRWPHPHPLQRHRRIGQRFPAVGTQRALGRIRAQQILGHLPRWKFSPNGPVRRNHHQQPHGAMGGGFIWVRELQFRRPSVLHPRHQPHYYWAGTDSINWIRLSLPRCARSISKRTRGRRLNPFCCRGTVHTTSAWTLLGATSVCNEKPQAWAIGKT